MYSEYVKNFERAAELLATWTDKSAPFQEVITRIQVRLGGGWGRVSTATPSVYWLGFPEGFGVPPAQLLAQAPAPPCPVPSPDPLGSLIRPSPPSPHTLPPSIPPQEQRGLRQPDSATPHAGTRAENPTLRAAAQGVCSEAASPGPRPGRCSE